MDISNERFVYCTVQYHRRFCTHLCVRRACVSGRPQLLCSALFHFVFTIRSISTLFTIMHFCMSCLLLPCRERRKLNEKRTQKKKKKETFCRCWCWAAHDTHVCLSLEFQTQNFIFCNVRTPCYLHSRLRCGLLPKIDKKWACGDRHRYLSKRCEDVLIDQQIPFKRQLRWAKQRIVQRKIKQQ